MRIVPIVIFALVGGMFADTYDRRRLLIVTQTTLAALAGILALLTFLQLENVAVVYLVTAAMSAATAFDSPAMQSLVPNLVPREHLTNALSLNATMFEIGTIAGPAIGGLLIANFSPGLVYAVNAVSFVAVILALLAIRYRGGRASGMGAGLGWNALVEGLRFVYHSPMIWSTMLLDAFATFFSSASTMLPIIAGDILHVGAAGYGILSTAQSAGALLAGFVMAARERHLSPGRGAADQRGDLWRCYRPLWRFDRLRAFVPALRHDRRGRHGLDGHPPDPAPIAHSRPAARPYDEREHDVLHGRSAAWRDSRPDWWLRPSECRSRSSAAAWRPSF